MIGEFDIIARYFAPLAAGEPGALGLLDDACVLEPPTGRRLVVTTDTMVAGVHFLPDDPPEQVAAKLLRVNLSDLAAMGATPYVYTLNTGFSVGTTESWIAAFARGLGADQARFGIVLVGGDTVATPGPATFTLTAFGTVAPGRELRRSTARAGDRVFVSGTIGDAALGLRVLRGEFAALAPAAREFLAGRYRLPTPRLGLGERLGGLAHAAVDVSDGLLADLGHIAETSRCAIDVNATRVPLSEASRTAVGDDPSWLAQLVSGGDDYELAFTAPAEAIPRVTAAAEAARVPVAEIGQVAAGPAGRVRLLDVAGRETAVAARGYRHF